MTIKHTTNTWNDILSNSGISYNNRSRRGRDRMVVGFTTTYAISVYHHWCCGFESRSGGGVQHYVMKFVPGSGNSSLSTGIFRKYLARPWYICSKYIGELGIVGIRLSVFCRTVGYYIVTKPLIKSKWFYNSINKCKFLSSNIIHWFRSKTYFVTMILNM